MNERTITDARLSIKSDEFSWDIDGHTQAHDYLLSPVLSLLRSSGARSVLDLGCGNGTLSGELSRSGFEVCGLDFSQSGIDLARKNFPHVHFGQHDVSRPIDAAYLRRFDAVISTEVIEHLLLPRALMQNAISALVPGGLLVVTTPFHGYLKNLGLALTNAFDTHWHPLRDYGHIKFFSRDTLTQLFREFGFLDLQYLTAGRIPPLAKSMILAGRSPA
jgi:2-polyprenyl-3-methyl-5-hydroxy-6-metoxy-1,4-benzoquinol methylase